MLNAYEPPSTTKESDSIVTIANTKGMNISDRHQTFLLGRGIEPSLASEYQIFTSKDALCFPFLENDEVVNRKFRGPQKKFWQDGGKQTLWNLDAIDEAIEFDTPLLICEGEMDALSAIQAGWTATVSVPAGAPSKKTDDDIEILNDNKFAYIWDLKDKLDKVKKFILAGDSDLPGQALNHELQRRLGVERCRFIKNTRKDLNEVLMQDGAENLLKLIDEAPEYPVKGLYKLFDFPDIANPIVYNTGFQGMDDNLLIELGKLMIVTGVPSHGKSEWTDRLVFNLAKIHGWHSCVGSFENAPVPNWRNTMRRRYWGQDPYHIVTRKKQEADEWVQKHFSFIAQHPDEEHEITLEFIIECATQSVLRDGAKVLLIDPWNEIEHKRNNDETDTEYVGRALRRLKAFARQYGVLVIVVAHPQKMNDKGNIKKPSPYDISGSANWYNKADYAIIVWRPDIHSPMVDIDIRKIKFQQYAGRPAILTYEYMLEGADYSLDISASDMRDSEELFKK